MNATGERLSPLIAALKLEAYAHFKPPCDSDYPMPACPLYPRHPDKPKGSAPQFNCRSEPATCCRQLMPVTNSFDVFSLYLVQ